MKETKVLTLPVGQLNANCYLYISQGHLVIIDPGDDSEYIIQKITDFDLNPTAILATHGHFDHIMAGFALQAAYNIPFYIHAKDLFLLKRMRETAIHFGEEDPGPPPISKPLSSPIGPFEIINIPGHTPGSVALYDKENSLIFTGDLIFEDGSRGETTHKYSSREKLFESITKILALPEDTIIFPGHGMETNIKLLKEKWATLG